MSGTILKLKNIEKWFGGVHALKGIDFSVDGGEIVGLIGENGAGKSTLIKLISGIYPPDNGKIYWGGKEVQITSVKKAQEIGIETVHEGGLTLIDGMSITRNIFIAREIKKSVGPLKIIDEKKERRIAEGLLPELGLDVSPDREIKFCSGGEKQGTAIARALYYKANLVILDEPTAGLAPNGCRKIMEFVRKLKEKGIGCVFSTPDVYRAFPVVDRFVVLVRGKVVANIRNEDTSSNKIENLMIVKST